MTALDLTILALATWRISFLLTREVGPLQALSKLRERTTLGGLLECIKCMSVWAALALFALWQFVQWPVIVLAISGGALLVDRMIDS